VFTVASKVSSLLRRRTLVLLALVVVAVVLGKFGHYGLWDGPAGG
jgi:hypothetical protein